MNARGRSSALVGVVTMIVTIFPDVTSRGCAFFESLAAISPTPSTLEEKEIEHTLSEVIVSRTLRAKRKHSDQVSSGNNGRGRRICAAEPQRTGQDSKRNGNRRTGPEASGTTRAADRN